MKSEEIGKILGFPDPLLDPPVTEISDISNLNFIYVKGIESLDEWMEDNYGKLPRETKLHKYPLGFLLFVKTNEHQYFKSIKFTEIEDIKFDKLICSIKIQTKESLFELKPFKFNLDSKKVIKLINFFKPFELVVIEKPDETTTSEILSTDKKYHIQISELNHIDFSSIRKSGEKLMEVGTTLVFIFLTNIVFLLISLNWLRSVPSENDLKNYYYFCLIWGLIDLFFFGRLTYLFLNSGMYLEEFYKDNLPNRKEEKL